jgi:hypothetical protein
MANARNTPGSPALGNQESQSAATPVNKGYSEKIEEKRKQIEAERHNLESSAKNMETAGETGCLVQDMIKCLDLHESSRAEINRLKEELKELEAQANLEAAKNELKGLREGV